MATRERSLSLLSGTTMLSTGLGSGDTTKAPPLVLSANEWGGQFVKDNGGLR